ncbi:MAG TPA: LytR C-terminal domain-containing protein, partial [Solirubrobacterales bacterium]|nr:LytR C-terminal domain-containing protein [Solirubrobacterales bacterium]
GNVGSDVEASGYVLGPVSSTTPGVEKTAVLYADGQKRAAQKVARDLGVDKATVEPVDRETRRLAGDADVVVIAGEDRTS